MSFNEIINALGSGIGKIMEVRDKIPIAIGYGPGGLEMSRYGMEMRNKQREKDKESSMKELAMLTAMLPPEGINSLLYNKPTGDSDIDGHVDLIKKRQTELKAGLGDFIGEAAQYRKLLAENKPKWQQITNSKYPAVFNPEDPTTTMQLGGIEPKPETSLSEEQLTQKALAGDKDAQNILDAMQKRKVEIANESRVPVEKNKTPFVNAQGNTVLVDTSSSDAQSIIDKQGLKPQQLYQQSQGQLSSDALSIEGAKYATTGVMPPLGMNNPIMRAKIVNAGAEWLKNQGVNPSDVPAFQAEFKGAKDTYVNMKKSTENFAAFESAMIKNMEYATKLSSTYPRTQFPKVNQLINAVKSGTGDTQIVKLGTAVYAAAMEFEKIRTAGTNITAAELSIGAQKKAEEIINKAQTHKQLLGAMEVMRVDAKNIMSSRRGQLKNLSSEMKNMGVGTEGLGGNKTPKTATDFLNKY